MTRLTFGPPVARQKTGVYGGAPVGGMRGHSLLQKLSFEGAAPGWPVAWPVLKVIWRQVGVAWFFAWSDTRARYKRSVLGPFWLVLGTAIGVAGLGVVWSALTRTDPAKLVPSLTVGIVLWNFMAGCITGAAGVFANNAATIKNIRTPSWRISLELLFQQLVNFVHNLVVMVVVLAIYPNGFSLATAPLAFIGMLLVIVNLMWIIQVLGLLGARFRDFDPLVAALMPILFFLSPVLYRSEQLGATGLVMRANPLSYLIDIVRNPLQGVVPLPLDYAAAIIMAAVGWTLAFGFTRAKAHRLAYWI